MRILMIGNSYTFFHDMPTAYLKGFADTAGIDLTVDTVLCGGWTLEKFADARTQFGAMVEEALQRSAYDVIVLQEQSVRPAAEHGYAVFFDAVRSLFKKCAANAPRILLYETWSHETGSQTLIEQGWSHTDMTWRLAASYEAIAEELGLEVAHVGRAFHEIYGRSPQIDLYAHDRRSHPSPAGSFLAAATLFARITGMDPATIPFDGGIPKDVARVLTRAAYRQHTDPTPIPNAYRIISKGITAH